MRRTIRTLLVGCVLLTAAACGTATDKTATPTVAGTNGGASGAAGNATPALASTCEALGQAYNKNIAALAESLTTLVADRKTVAQAQESLSAFATAVADATKASDDAQLRADGKQAAEQMRAKSADKKFFAAIKTGEDVNKTMGATLTAWLSPVTRHCS
jgi:hypothetical protein